jgi:RNA polymerase sigma-70 factor (sigma-E family)
MTKHEEFLEFYNGSKDRCLRSVVGLGLRPDEAEEALAEAYMRAWSRWATVSNHQAPEAWVVRTAVNANISWWRRRRREHAVADVPDQAADHHGATRDAQHLDLIAAMRGLPRAQRQVVVMRYLLDLTTDQTAQELGIAPGTVASHLHRGLAALRVHLTPTEGLAR